MCDFTLIPFSLPAEAKDVLSFLIYQGEIRLSDHVYPLFLIESAWFLQTDLGILCMSDWEIFLSSYDLSRQKEISSARCGINTQVWLLSEWFVSCEIVAAPQIPRNRNNSIVGCKSLYIPGQNIGNDNDDSKEIKMLIVDGYQIVRLRIRDKYSRITLHCSYW